MVVRETRQSENSQERHHIGRFGDKGVPTYSKAASIVIHTNNCACHVQIHLRLWEVRGHRYLEIPHCKPLITPSKSFRLVLRCTHWGQPIRHFVFLLLTKSQANFVAFQMNNLG